jgi:hypothetical protein
LVGKADDDAGPTFGQPIAREARQIVLEDRLSHPRIFP